MIDGLSGAFTVIALIRVTGLPRTTVQRVLGVLLEMGLLSLIGSGGLVWARSMSWVPELVAEQYACWLRSRSIAKRSVDKRPRVAV